MHQASAAPSHSLSLHSSISEVDAELRRLGIFYYSHHYVKDREFKTHVLSPLLTSMEDVHRFLDSLDADNQKTAWKRGCTKAYVARNSLKFDQTSTTDLDWALRSLARARRTCCSCHDTGSFNHDKN